MFGNRLERQNLDHDDRYYHYRVSYSCVHDRHHYSCYHDDVSTDVEVFGSWIWIDSICIDRYTRRHRVQTVVGLAVGSDDHGHDHVRDAVVLNGYSVSSYFPWYDGDYC